MNLFRHLTHLPWLTNSQLLYKYISSEVLSNFSTENMDTHGFVEIMWHIGQAAFLCGEFGLGSKSKVELLGNIFYGLNKLHFTQGKCHLQTLFGLTIYTCIEEYWYLIKLCNGSLTVL